MTQHTPATPGSTRSILAPHMFVVGGKREMLQADWHMALSRVVAAEKSLCATLNEMQDLHGDSRKKWRVYVGMDVHNLRKARRDHAECRARFHDFINWKA